MSNNHSHAITELTLIIEKISFVYWIFTVPFYILLVCAMIHAQMKNIAYLKSSFYKICIITGFVDIVTLLNSYIGGVFPSWGWFTVVYSKLGKPYAYVYLFIVWGSGINQALSVSMLAANRLSAIIFPQRYHKLWSGQRLKIAVAMQIVPGYTVPLVILSNDVGFETTDYGGLMPVFSDKTATDAYFTAGGIFLSANSIFLIVSYCYLFYVLRRRNNAQLKTSRRNAVRSDNTREKRSDFRLFLMASAIVVIQLIFLVFMFMEVCPWIDIATSVSYLLYNPLSNLYAGASAYLLWIFSNDLRNYIYIILRIKKRMQPSQLQIAGWDISVVTK